MGKWAAFALTVLGALAANGATVGEPRVVLLLNSYGDDFAPFNEITASLKSELALRLGSPVDILEASLQSARSGQLPEDETFVDYLHGLFLSRQPDLVVPIGGPAVRFAQRQRQTLFPRSPMLYAAVDQRLVEEGELNDNDAVVAIRNDVPGLVRNILDVLPQTRHVAVVVGASPLEIFWKEEMLREFRQFEPSIEFTWFDGLTLEQMKLRASKMPPGSAILYAVLLVDASGVPVVREHGLSEIVAVANAPVFGVYSSHVDKGTVGGRVVSDLDLGESTAAVAVRILHGESPGDIKTPPQVAGAPVYNWKGLRRWKISEASLPADSQVRFREPTIWDRYQPYLLAGITVLLLQSALIAALVWQHIHLRRAEREAASLGGRLLMVHENERRRIARELHDDVTQRLAALAIESTRGEGAARSVRQGLVKLSEDVHALSYRLHPSVIEDLGLVEALRAECDGVARNGSVQIDFDAHGIPTRLPPDTALCLFRIAQESLRNIVRHADASAVRVSLSPSRHGLGLEVRDNGAGFDTGKHADHPSLGLASMRERVNLLNGKLEIESSPGHGTTVTAWVPFLEAA